MANNEERGAPYVGFTAGMTLGMMAGVVLGLLMVDNLALGLGVGIALGVLIPFPFLNGSVVAVVGMSGTTAPTRGQPLASA